MANNKLTTRNDAPVADSHNNMTDGPRGPALLQEYYLIEQMANFNRKRIPEHQPHARCSGTTTCQLDGERNTIIHRIAVQQFIQRKEVTL
jgi:catalase